MAGVVTITLVREENELDVPKWTMTEDPHIDRHLEWDLENDPEYQPNVPR